MSESQLQYDDATHTYMVDGVVYPSVTQVLSEAGLIDDTWYTEEGAERGKAVALITEMWDKNQLDEVTLRTQRPEYAGYFDAWLRFLDERVAAVLAVEERVCDHVYGFAGTLDRRVRLIADTTQTIPDIKTGAKAWWHRYQTAAYMGCCDPGVVTKRMAVYLKPDGKYTAEVHYNYPHDIDVFRAALCIANEKRAHGKTGDRYANRGSTA